MCSGCSPFIASVLWWAECEVSVVVSRACPFAEIGGGVPVGRGEAPLRDGGARAGARGHDLPSCGCAPVEAASAPPPQPSSSPEQEPRFQVLFRSVADDRFPGDICENSDRRRSAFHVMTHIVRYICALPFADSFRFPFGLESYSFGFRQPANVRFPPASRCGLLFINIGVVLVCLVLQFAQICCYLVKS